MLTLEQLQAGIVIPIDKPRQWTSFQTVNKVKATIRNLYGIKNFKIGHAGTLDPLATGILLVCIGRATKSIPQLQNTDKVYTGTLVLGATTPCYDLERPIEKYYPYQHITLPLLEQQAAKLTGTLQQTPPIFSAVKIDGQRAYLYARAENPTATPQPKTVTVHNFQITAFHPGKTQNQEHQTQHTQLETPSSHLYNTPQETIPPQLPQADFRIACGKGTYIRSLARDLGHACGSGAFLASLRREQVGNYTTDKAIQLHTVENHLKTLTL